MLKSFFKYYKPYKKILLLTILGSLVTSILELAFPLVLRRAINVILPAKELELLGLFAVGLLIMYTVSFAVNYCVMFYGHVMGAKIENDMRHLLFKHLGGLSFRFFDNSKTGQLISRITGDVSEIGELAFMGPHDVVICSITMLGTMAVLLYLNWPLAILICALLLFKTYDSLTINRQMKAAFRVNRVRAGEISAQVEDSLSGIRVVKAYTNEEYEYNKFSAVSHSLLNARIASYKLLARFGSSVSYFTNVINAVLFAVGGYLVITASLPFSDFMAFFLYVGIFMRPLFRLTALMEMYQRGMAGYHRYCEIMEEKPDFEDAPNALTCERLRGDIEFHEVVFHYDPAKPVLRNLSFRVQENQKVAIVGPTGAGKTTICNLIPRFYDVCAGAITIGGKDIREFKLEDLRKNIGIVQQDVFIFSDNVRENIAYGRPEATEEDIIAAAKAAEAHDFIMQLPQGYDTNIGERGVKLSGGQKQRLSIARIFLKNPPILILDEATSSLDNATEKKIQKALNKLSENRTSLIIAHRLATVHGADKIEVLTEQGIVEEGTHEELLGRQGVYNKLYEAQFMDIEK